MLACIAYSIDAFSRAGSSTEAVTAELKQLEKERDEAVQAGKHPELSE